jgi:hypothetical protein
MGKSGGEGTQEEQMHRAKGYSSNTSNIKTLQPIV